MATRFFLTFAITLCFCTLHAHAQVSGPYALSGDLHTINRTYGNTIVVTGTNKLLMLSHDYGDTWVQGFYDGVGSVRSADFFTRQLGIAATSTGDLLASSNGGRKWVPLPVTHNVRDVQVKNETTAFAITATGRIIRTTDAGIIWDTVQSVGIEGGLQQILYMGRQSWLVLAVSGTLYISADDCATFTVASAFSGVTPSQLRIKRGYGNSLTMFTSKVGVPTCFLSLDSGRTWAEQARAGNSSIAVPCSDSAICWMTNRSS